MGVILTGIHGHADFVKFFTNFQSRLNLSLLSVKFVAKNSQKNATIGSRVHDRFFPPVRNS